MSAFLADLIGGAEAAELHDQLRAAADAWADDRNDIALEQLFAPTPMPPGQSSVEYVVAPIGARLGSVGGDVRYDSPVQAWSVFRVAGPGMALLSASADVSRRIAEQPGTSDVRFIAIGTGSLSGPAAAAAVASWHETAAAYASTSRSEGTIEAKAPTVLADTDADPRGESSGGATAFDELFFEDRLEKGPAKLPLRARLRSERAGTGVDRRKQFLGTEPQWRLAYIGLALVAVGLSFILIRVTLDDSFITWRYGKTFVATGHWNWNRTGPRVEAYSNPLYAVLSVLGAVVRLPAELFFKLVSFGIVAAYCVLVRRLRLPRRQEFLLLAALLASPVFFLQVYGGLETASFALLIAAVFGMVYRRGELTASGFVAAFALALSRPEGIVFAFVAMAWAVVITGGRRQVRGTAAVLGAWVVYWIWRWQHFGHFFPNPYYMKSTAQGSLGHKVLDTITSASPALGLAAVVGLAFVLFGRTSVGGRDDRRTFFTHLTPLVLSLLSMAMVLGLYKHSELVMDPGHRFYWQVLLPVVLVVLCRPLVLPGPDELPSPGSSAGRSVSDVGALAGIGVATATALAWQTPDLNSGFVLVCAVIVVLGVSLAGFVWRTRGAAALAAAALAVGIGYLPASEAVGWVAYRYRLEHAHEAMGKVLARAHVHGGVVMFDAGVLPYGLSNQVIDPGGLANAQVTHGGLRSEDLSKANVQIVILGFEGPALTPNPFGGAGAPVAYAYALDHKFWSANGALFNSGYYLNYFVSPSVAATGLPMRLQHVFNASQKQNGKTDDAILLDNLWSFPFLS